VPVALRELVADCAALVEGEAARKGLALETEVGDAVPDQVLADPVRLRQVLLNLLANAIKFTTQGVVRLALQASPAPAPMLRFSVTDTGMGIAGEKLPRLFERFSQADSATTRHFGGTGLGLAISRHLVELMGGHITVESAEGRGSTFCFSIPLVPAAMAAPAAAAPTSGIARRLLLAEDNDTNREIVAAVLRQAGHTVVAVAGGAEAVAAARRERFDAILMDVQMPGMDGYAATRRLRADANDVPIIGLTANAMPEEAARCRAAGMDLHVPKPVDWPVLLAAIERLAAERAAGRTGASTEDSRVLDRARHNDLRGRIGPERFADLVEMFTSDAQRRFAPELEDAPRAAIGREAHSFGGAAGMLGFSELAEACRRLEIAARSGAELAGLFADCRAARARALAALARGAAAAEPPRATA
jgi:CheY-like chemotaxis protein/HPt (histidine-containing phosphotransfer) domain-containing protein